VPVEETLRSGLATVIEFVPKLLLFLVILIVGLIVAKVIRRPRQAPREGKMIGHNWDRFAGFRLRSGPALPAHELSI
jgi:hypothetical protein